MNLHWKGIVALSIVTLFAFFIGITQSIYVGVAILAASIVIWYVTAVAWMQPRDQDRDERHAGGA
jgi:heme O synthase-like polyprenyltransferase